MLTSDNTSATKQSHRAETVCATTQPATFSTPSLPPARPQAYAQNAPSPSQLQAPCPPPTPGPSPSPSAYGDRLNLVDLELLHTFTTSTYATLSENALIRDAWRLSVLPMCLSTEFLTRTVLAVSALHLGCYRPGRRDFYTNLALTYHQRATREVVNLVHVENVTTKNWEHMYVFSALTIYFSNPFSSPLVRGRN